MASPRAREIQFRRFFLNSSDSRSQSKSIRHSQVPPPRLPAAGPDRTGGRQTLVVHLVPIHRDGSRASSNRSPAIPITNVLIRYSTVATTQENIGTGVKTFQIPNCGNVPCEKSAPCSPDGKWKAAVASESLDAGEGNDFRNARVSCIAGPCPFTRIDFDGFSQGGRHIKVSVRNWSDTTTFLLQAEVFRRQINDIVRMAYPVILGTSLISLCRPAAEGPSIEAELNGENIIFPLGPNPILSWADCNVSVARNKASFTGAISRAKPVSRIKMRPTVAIRRG